jgi:hypothetical protein
MPIFTSSMRYLSQRSSRTGCPCYLRSRWTKPSAISTSRSVGLCLSSGNTLRYNEHIFRLAPHGCTRNVGFTICCSLAQCFCQCFWAALSRDLVVRLGERATGSATRHIILSPTPPAPPNHHPSLPLELLLQSELQPPSTTPNSASPPPSLGDGTTASCCPLLRYAPPPSRSSVVAVGLAHF